MGRDSLLWCGIFGWNVLLDLFTEGRCRENVTSSMDGCKNERENATVNEMT